VTRLINAADVVDLYRLFESHGLVVWVDGGWGVDALLGEQTREHADLDIAIQTKGVERLRALLAERGFQEQVRDDTTPWNFVLGDDRGRDVDVHGIVLDVDGNGIYGPPERGEMYPAVSLTGTGMIGGHDVRCIEAKSLLDFHSGYELDEKDIHDVLALCARFGFEIPEDVRNRFEGW
jgi:lincosamide nucleotidyltransferase A/C/D/E